MGPSGSRWALYSTYRCLLTGTPAAVLHGLGMRAQPVADHALEPVNARLGPDPGVDAHLTTGSPERVSGIVCQNAAAPAAAIAAIIRNAVS